MKLKKIIILSILTTISIVLNIVEGFIPSIGVPGVKLGLANIITILVLYEFGEKETIVVVVLRVLLSSILRGNFLTITFYMSACGALFSFISMSLLKRTKYFSIYGVSVVGSLFHCLGQIIVAMIMLSTKEIIYYLPLIALLSIPTGIFTAFISERIIKTKILMKFKNNNE